MGKGLTLLVEEEGDVDGVGVGVAWCGREGGSVLALVVKRECVAGGEERGRMDGRNEYEVDRDTEDGKEGETGESEVGVK